MPNKSFFSKKYVQLTLLYGGLLAFFLTTNPGKLPVGLLLLPFIWLFIALFMTVRLILAKRARKKEGELSRKTWVRAAAVALLPTFLLLLDSINQLTLKDGLLFAVFVVLVIFYANKLSFNTSAAVS